jgi:hypothetical protein
MGITSDPSDAAHDAASAGAARLVCPSTHPLGCALFARVPLDGGAPDVFDAQDGVAGPIVVAGDRVVTTLTTALHEYRTTLHPIAHPTMSLGFDAPDLPVESMVFAKGRLVVAVQKGTGAIVEVPIDGSPQRVIVNTMSPSPFAFDGETVAWSDDYAAGKADLFVAPIGKGAGKRAARGEIDPFAISLDGGDLFWSTHDPAPEAQTLRVMRSGAATPETIASGQGTIVSIAVDATDVVWLSIADGEVPIVRRAPRAGGTVVDVARGLASTHGLLNVPRLVLCGGVVWFDDRASLLRVAKSGGDVRVVASAPRGEISAFDVDDASAWIAVTEPATAHP